MKKYEEIELKIRELQAEVEKLKFHEKMENGEVLPERFERKHALKLLSVPRNWEDLDNAFIWSSTPQGEDYWDRLNDLYCDEPLPREAIEQIQKWVIASYRRQLGE